MALITKVIRFEEFYKSASADVLLNDFVESYPFDIKIIKTEDIPVLMGACRAIVMTYQYDPTKEKFPSGDRIPSGAYSMIPGKPYTLLYEERDSRYNGADFSELAKNLDYFKYQWKNRVGYGLLSKRVILPILGYLIPLRQLLRLPQISLKPSILIHATMMRCFIGGQGKICDFIHCYQRNLNH